MSMRISALCALVVLCVTSTERLEAQMGPIIDWIIQLSGPGFVRAGWSWAAPVRMGDRSGAVRIAGMGGVSTGVDDAGNPPDARVFIGTGQLTLEVPVAGPFEVIGGVAGHRFFGDDVDAFWSVSFPLQLAVRPWRSRPGLDGLKLGGGVNVFWFPENAFAPLSVDVQQSGFELGPNVFLIFDLRFP